MTVLPELPDPDPVLAPPGALVAALPDIPVVAAAAPPEFPVGGEFVVVAATFLLGESTVTVHSLPAVDQEKVAPLAGMVISPAIFERVCVPEAVFVRLRSLPVDNKSSNPRPLTQ